MSSNYIGIFDSGLGGLTAVKELMHLLPNEPIVYFGDTGRVPYGSKSNDTIIKYTKSDIRFLNTFDLKLIVIACGTASTIALRSVEGMVDVPVFGVVGAAAKAADTSGDRAISITDFIQIKAHILGKDKIQARAC